MPSEKQIEAAHKKANDILDTYVTWEEIIAILAAAKQAEPAPSTLIDTISDEVWNHDASKDNCMVVDKDGLDKPDPVARSGEVKWQQIAKVVAENLPSPYALDDVWKQTSDGACFDLSHANNATRTEWEALAVAILSTIESPKAID